MMPFGRVSFLFICSISNAHSIPVCSGYRIRNPGLDPGPAWRKNFYYESTNFPNIRQDGPVDQPVIWIALNQSTTNLFFLLEFGNMLLYCFNLILQIRKMFLQSGDSLRFGHESRSWKFAAKTSTATCMLMPPSLSPVMTASGTTHKVTPFSV